MTSPAAVDDKESNPTKSLGEAVVAGTVIGTTVTGATVAGEYEMMHFHT